MTIKYYAWKNGKQISENQEWEEMSRTRFIEICNKNRELDAPQRRYFAQIPGIESGDTYLYMECTYEQYKQSRAEKSKRTRQRKECLDKKESFNPVLSLDQEYIDETGGTSPLSEFIPDEQSFFEEELIRTLDIKKALEKLSPEELKLIELLFLSEYATSESNLSKQLGVPRRTLGCQKKKILKKLKKSFASF